MFVKKCPLFKEHQSIQRNIRNWYVDAFCTRNSFVQSEVESLCMLHVEEVTQMWRSCSWEPVLTWKQRTMEAYVAMLGNGRILIIIVSYIHYWSMQYLGDMTLYTCLWVEPKPDIFYTCHHHPLPFDASAEHQCAIDVGISSGRTPLFTASSYGQVSLVQMLLDARAQVDAKNDDGPRAQIAVIASPSMRQKLHKVELLKFIL